MGGGVGMRWGCGDASGCWGSVRDKWSSCRQVTRGVRTSGVAWGQVRGRFFIIGSS